MAGLFDPLYQLARRLSTKYDTSTPRYKITINCEPSVEDSDYSDPTDENDEWRLEIYINCKDLGYHMRKGLFSTTKSLSDYVLPEQGTYEEASGHTADAPWLKRTWKIRELPDMAQGYSRWWGTIRLCSSSVQTLASFDLNDLGKRHVTRAEAKDWKSVSVRPRKYKWKTVFSFAGSEPKSDINCFYQELRPSRGSWWFAPHGRKHKSRQVVPVQLDKIIFI